MRYSNDGNLHSKHHRWVAKVRLVIAVFLVSGSLLGSTTQQPLRGSSKQFADFFNSAEDSVTRTFEEALYSGIRGNLEVSRKQFTSLNESLNQDSRFPILGVVLDIFDTLDHGKLDPQSVRTLLSLLVPPDQIYDIRLEKSVQEVMAQYPALYFPHMLQAMQLTAAGRNDAALAEIQQAIQLNGNSSFAYLVKGSIDHDLGNLPSAEAMFARSWQLSPGNYQACIHLVLTIIEQGNTKKAIESIDRCLQRFPEAPDLLYYKGMAYFDSGKYALAEKALTALIANGWKEGSTLAMLGDIHLMHRSYDKAIENYTESLTYDSTNIKVYASRAYCYLETGKYDLAQKDLEAAQSWVPSDPYLSGLLGHLALGRQDADAAINPHFSHPIYCTGAYTHNYSVRLHRPSSM